MKNSGFTLVEVIAVIALIAALVLLVVPKLADMDTKSKEKMYNAKVTEILAGAYKYGTDNIDNLTNECLDVTVGTLLKLGYVKSDDNSGFYVTNPKNNESMNNLIICVKYENGKVVTNVSNW